MVITVGDSEAWLVGGGRRPLLLSLGLFAAAVWLPKITRWLARIRRRAPRRGHRRDPSSARSSSSTATPSTSATRASGCSASTLPSCPQRGGWKARGHLIGMAGGREVAVEPVDLDCYGRIVARVWLGPTDLGERMVRDGSARGLDDWCADYAAAEFEARRGKRGLWATVGIPDPAAHRRWKAQATPRR